MRYSLKLQQKVLNDSSSLSVKELSEKYNLSESLIKKWLLLNIPEEKLKYSVRQKFYNVIPPLEAKIEVIYSKFISDKITDEEWENCSKSVSQAIIDFAYKVYKLGISDSVS